MSYSINYYISINVNYIIETKKSIVVVTKYLVKSTAVLRGECGVCLINYYGSVCYYQHLRTSEDSGCLLIIDIIKTEETPDYSIQVLQAWVLLF